MRLILVGMVISSFTALICVRPSPLEPGPRLTESSCWINVGGYGGLAVVPPLAEQAHLRGVVLAVESRHCDDEVP